MSITKRKRVASLIIITADTSRVFSLRDWNLNYINAKPLYSGSYPECKEFAKYHEGIF